MPTEKKDSEVDKAQAKKEQQSQMEKDNLNQEAVKTDKAPEKEHKADEKQADKPAEAEGQKKSEEKIEAKAGKEAELAKPAKKPEEESPEPEKPVFSRLEEYAGVRKDLPDIKIGDVIKVSYRVIEGGKERIQLFEGIVIARKNSGISRTITVRKTSFGVAVERIFPLNSKLIQKIQVKKHSRVRRAKLYYLRELKGKAARLKELR